jgi:hypothetical protein
MMWLSLFVQGTPITSSAPQGNRPESYAMSDAQKLTVQARSLPVDSRKNILREIPEVELHPYLARMFRAMNLNWWVEVTHGDDEFGKDLVIVRDDALGSDVIAVVVKRGDIRGKTSGDVDVLAERVSDALTAKGERITREIESQIRQAKSHDAVSRDRVSRLQVNQVIAIVVGEMSANARQRLEKEVMPQGKVFDLPWLVDSFTAYYPQVFFEGRVVDVLDQLIDNLEKDPFYSRSGKTLSECFVEPIVAQLDGNLSLNAADLALQVKHKKIRLSELPASIVNKSRVLLVGDTGSGKSKALAKLCIDSYRDALTKLTRSAQIPNQIPVPLLISARAFADATTPAALLQASPIAQANDRLTVGTLMIDGLDELPATARLAVLDKAQRFATELRCSVVVTTRKTAAFNGPVAGFDRLELLPFQFGQAMKLVERLGPLDVINSLKEGLLRIKAQIPMNPLSLQLLVELVIERKEVPASITELYDRYFDLVFGRWEREKGIEVLFDYLIKKRFLAALAYNEFYRRGRLETPQVDFDAFLQLYADNYGWDADKLRDFLKEIVRAGILDVHAEVSFRHRSFLDYFVALHVHERRTEFEELNMHIAELYFSDLWGDASFFFAGISREISIELLEAIFSWPISQPQQVAQKLLAGRILQAAWHSTKRVKEAGIRSAIGYAPEVARTVRTQLAAFRKFPPLFADFLALMVAESSLASVVLVSEEKILLDEMRSVGATDADSLFTRLALIAALRTNLTNEELASGVTQLVADVKDKALNSQDEARILLLASMNKEENKAIATTVGRRLRRLYKAAPAVFHKLIPTRALAPKPK